MMHKLVIRGAREHNLKNIDLSLTKNQLIVISGLSGSGKSSLAFDTIFAEGQRRYVESLSSYARMFLGRMEKPDVEYISGLSPAISIEQKSTNRNPRSTVGTITEIYDYWRLLWARVGEPHCPECGRAISTMSVDQIIQRIFEAGEDSRIMISSPVAIRRKGEFKKVFEDGRKAGYQRAKVDGELLFLDDLVKLDKNIKHSVDIVVDRLILKAEERQRLASSIETAIGMSGGMVKVTYYSPSEHEVIYSEKNSCPYCGISIGEIEPRLFSFNSPYGACEGCNGLGYRKEFDPALIVPDTSKSFNQRALEPVNPEAPAVRAPFDAVAKKYGFSLDTPFKDYPEKIKHLLIYGDGERIEVEYKTRYHQGVRKSIFNGVVGDLNRRMAETRSISIRTWISRFQHESICPECAGERLRKEALAVTVGGLNIMQASRMSVAAALAFFTGLELSETGKKIAAPIMKEIIERLEFLRDVGLDYLTLDRSAATLSGGEAQRIRLATQIGSALSGVLYVLDEPSIGLHQRDNDRLIATLKHLRDLGNTVIVVEHDEDTIRQADWLVDLGPGAGVNGGYITAQGTVEDVEKCEDSVTGNFLSGRLSIPVPEKRREGNGKSLVLKGAKKHNLKGIDVSIPLGKMVVITGVSGSGKSTLLNEILIPALKRSLNKKTVKCDDFRSLTGCGNIDKVIHIDQSPIGRTPRSNPATYVGVFDHIRKLYASLPESRARGYKGGRFSFNVPGGRCEHCKGDGTLKIEMNFLPDVYVKCDVCKGKRFNKETLKVTYRGKNIADVLDMTMNEAAEFFSAIPPIKRKLDTVCSVGLGYIKLGQSALTLSGGEAQRVKLALELSKTQTGKTLYVLDEPTTGLHFADVKRLLEVLNRLVDRGNTVVLIEHNLDVIKQADHLIDLGPEGGDGGGEVVGCGTPEQLVENPASWTGRYLKRYLYG